MSKIVITMPAHHAADSMRCKTHSKSSLRASCSER
jgi:hypothetical protein